jgi:hypothetical protein
MVSEWDNSGIARYFGRNNIGEATTDSITESCERTRAIEERISQVDIVSECANKLCLQSRDITPETVLLHSRYTAFPSNSDSEDEEAHYQRMDSALFTFNLSKVSVRKDGDCLFHAMIRQLKISDNYMTPRSSKGTVYDETADALWLRLSVLEEIENSTEHYRVFLGNMTRTKFAAQVQLYSSPGQFAGDFGDLLPVAVANFLKRIIILISSSPFRPYQSIIPRVTPMSSEPLYLAHNTFGCGHFDAVKRASCESESSEEELPESANLPNETIKTQAKRCRCGVNNKTKNRIQGKSFCRPGGRCPCVMKKQAALIAVASIVQMECRGKG